MKLGSTRRLIYTQGSVLPAFVTPGKKAHHGTEEAAQGHADNESYQRRPPHRCILSPHPFHSKTEVNAIFQPGMVPDAS
jgi:hypothetical protein